MAQIKLNATYGMTGTLPAVSGANLTTLNATNISSGTLNAARYVGGKVLQTVASQLNDSGYTTVSTSWLAIDDMSVAITPSATSSKILVIVAGSTYIQGTNYNVYGQIRLLRGSTEIARQEAMYDSENSTFAARLGQSFSIVKRDSPATTSATTYKIQIRVAYTSYSASIRLPSVQNGESEMYGGERIQLLEIGA